MKAVKTFAVRPYLPENLERLRELTHNVWWCWNPDAIELLRRIDSKTWDKTGHNPVLLLSTVGQDRLNYLAGEISFQDHLSRVMGVFDEYLTEATWFASAHPGIRQCQIAYFSFEFGLSESIATYSGGLGVLAGDHLKSASDLGVPMIGVGLLYQSGYFRQYLNSDGWQQEEYPTNDFHSLPAQPMLNDDGAPLKIDVPCLGEPVKAAVWKLLVGRVTLLLLDTNLPENSPRGRAITADLYGGDQDMRIRQEILLGIGGALLFNYVPFKPGVYHMNEGHPAFLALARIHGLVQRSGCTFDEAFELVAASDVFTTHTSVPAGIDRFDPALMLRYFEGFYQQLGLDADRFLALGRENPANKGEPFCMTVLAMKTSWWRNAVSKLHGEVSRKMWHHLWPSVAEGEVPITSITNGIHTPSWISADLAGLCDRYFGSRWRQEPASTAAVRADPIPDTELWRTHERRRERLVAYARRRLRAQSERRGAPPVEVAQADEVLDPEALTIGFARRFATYKRANLLLRDAERLTRILTDRDRPVQIIFAGKAHPQDQQGKELIREIVHFARRPDVRNRVVFIEDYDMTTSRYMVQGVDVWLNTPRRPLEASGTSGMKAAANGALNCSILDGWWVEGYTPETGFAIGRGEEYTGDLEYQDKVESESLFDLLEKEIIPHFYERGPDGLPRRWITLMQSALRQISPVFSSNRMVREYTERAYLPAILQWRTLLGDTMARAKALAAWKKRVLAAWPQVRIESWEDDCDTTAIVDDQFGVKVHVSLGPLKPEDVKVELYLGRVDVHGSISEHELVEMACTNPEATAKYDYAAIISCRAAGPHGYTVRVRPDHPDMMSCFDMGMIYWADTPS